MKLLQKFLGRNDTVWQNRQGLKKYYSTEYKICNKAIFAILLWDTQWFMVGNAVGICFNNPLISYVQEC